VNVVDSSGWIEYFAAIDGVMYVARASG